MPFGRLVDGRDTGKASDLAMLNEKLAIAVTTASSTVGCTRNSVTRFPSETISIARDETAQKIDTHSATSPASGRG